MTIRRYFSAAALGAAAIVATLFCPRVGQTDEPYALGVFPFLPPARLEETHGPFAIALSAALGRHVEFRTRSTFEAFRNEVANQTFDIIFVQPFDYVVAADKYGYRPLARANEPLTAVVVVKEDSELERLHDLNHKILAMPPMSAAVSRLTKAALSEIDLDVSSDLAMRHYRSHPACLQSVLIGEADACATNIVPLRVFLSTRNVALRILAETEAIPHVLFAAHERVPQHDREVIRRSILEFGDTAAGRTMLDRAGWSSGFVTAKDEDYDIVRSMSDEPSWE